MINPLKAITNRLLPPTFSSVLIGLVYGLRSGEVVFVPKNERKGEAQKVSTYDQAFIDSITKILGRRTSNSYFDEVSSEARVKLSRRAIERALLAVGERHKFGAGINLGQFRQAIETAHDEADPEFEYLTFQLAKMIEASEDSNVGPAAATVFKMLANLLRDIKLIPDRNTEGAGVRRE